MSATQDSAPITPGLDPKGVEGAGSTELEKACTHATELLEAFLKDGSAHCPHFLPRSKAVLLATCHKAGLGLGFEHGTGVLMARLPGEAAAAGGLRPSEFAAFKSLAWSPPCFISLAGLSSGFTAGLQRADTMIGVLTDAALDRIMHGGMLSLTAEWTVCLLDHNNSDAPASFHQHDLAVCTLTSGLMVDVSVSGATLRVDERRNRRAYGREVSASQLLRGEVAPPPAAVRLAQRLCQADSHVVAAAFEPSHAGSEGPW